jgi:hypothetical protein
MKEAPYVRTVPCYTLDATTAQFPDKDEKLKEPFDQYSPFHSLFKTWLSSLVYSVKEVAFYLKFLNLNL